MNVCATFVVEIIIKIHLIFVNDKDSKSKKKNNFVFKFENILDCQLSNSIRKTMKFYCHLILSMERWQYYNVSCKHNSHVVWSLFHLKIRIFFHFFFVCCIYGVFVFVLPNLSMYSYCTCCDCVMFLCNEYCCYVCNCVCMRMCIYDTLVMVCVHKRLQIRGLIHAYIYIFLLRFFFHSFTVFEVLANNHFDRTIPTNPQYRIVGNHTHTHEYFHHSANKSIFSYFFLNSM